MCPALDILSRGIMTLRAATLRMNPKIPARFKTPESLWRC